MVVLQNQQSSGGPALGSGIDPDKANGLLDDLSRHLRPGERVHVVAKAERLRPLLTHLAVTSMRVLGLAGSELRRRGPASEVSLGLVVDAEIRKTGFARPNSLILHLQGGAEMDFGNVVPAQDNELVLTIIRATHGDTPATADSTVPEPDTPDDVLERTSRCTPPAKPPEPAETNIEYPVPARGASMDRWWDEIPISGTVELPPDPRALEGLGRNHSLETALADLVDNSIDAGATNVLIRLVRQLGALRTLYVIDNGRGIQSDEIDLAMTLGGKRNYGAADLGHFGLGLKAASFSQAKMLTVMSQADDCPPVARRWAPGDGRQGFLVDVVESDFAQAALARDWRIPWTGHGTVIRWDDVTGFPVTSDPARVEEFISSAIPSLSRHLGLVFHRIIADRRVQIFLDVEEAGAGGPGARFVVDALNPFGYRRSPHPEYPKDLVAESSEATLTFRCHIWPGRSNMPEFRLPGGPENHQGLYVYRNDRLIQAGGDWGGITTPDKRLQLARVEVDIDDNVARFLNMNAEKSRINFGPEFTHLAEGAVASDGTSFIGYIEAIRQTSRDAGRRTRQRRPMLPPGTGFSAGLQDSIEGEISVLENGGPVGVEWKSFEPGDEAFFEVDREAETIWVNELYRATFDGARRKSSGDQTDETPVIKALLYLLMETVFQGERLGPKDKDDIALWQGVLTAAAKRQ